MKKRSKRKENIIIAIAIVIIVLGLGYIINYYGNSFSNNENLGYADINVQASKTLIENNPNLIIIDVSPHYDKGHIPGAVNYYVGDGSLDDAIQMLDKNGVYLVYCHIDSASILGAEKLVKAGFENVYRLEGNYAAWVDAGYPVEY